MAAKSAPRVSSAECDVSDAPDGAAAVTLAPGCRVKIFGLESEGGKKLNGQQGTLARLVPDKGRWEVSLLDGRVVSLKPDCLQVAPPVDDSGWAPGDQARLAGLCERGVDPKLAALNSNLGLLVARATGKAWIVEVAGKQHIVEATNLRVCSAADEAHWSLGAFSALSKGLLGAALLATLVLLVEAESACRRLASLRDSEVAGLPGLRVAVLAGLAPAGSLLWIMGTVAGCYVMHSPLLDPQVRFPQISELGVGPQTAKALYRCGFSAAAALLGAMVLLHRELCLPHLPGGVDGDAGASFTRCGAAAAAGVALQGIFLLEPGLSTQSAVHGVGALVFFGGVWMYMAAAGKLYLPEDSMPSESSPDFDDAMNAAEEATASSLLALPLVRGLVALRHRFLMRAPLAVFVVPLINQLTERAPVDVPGAASPGIRSMMGLMQWLIVLDFALIFASYGPELVAASWLPVPVAAED